MGTAYLYGQSSEQVSGGTEIYNTKELEAQVVGAPIQTGDMVRLSYQTGNFNDFIYYDKNKEESFLSNVQDISFCPNLDNQIAIVTGGNKNPASIYYVNGNELTFVREIEGMSYGCTFCTFSNDGSYAVICDSLKTGTAYVKIFKVNGTHLEYVSTINPTTAYRRNSTFKASFTPDSNSLIISGGHIFDVYSFSNGNVTFLYSLANDFTGYGISNVLFCNIKNLVYITVYNSDTYLCTVLSYKYTYVDGSIVFAYYEYKDNFDSDIYTLSVSYNDEYLIIGGAFTDGLRLYTIDSNCTTVFKSIIYKNAQNDLFVNDYSLIVKFSDYSNHFLVYYKYGYDPETDFNSYRLKMYHINSDIPSLAYDDSVDYQDSCNALYFVSHGTFVCIFLMSFGGSQITTYKANIIAHTLSDKKEAQGKLSSLALGKLTFSTDYKYAYSARENYLYEVNGYKFEQLESNVDNSDENTFSIDGNYVFKLFGYDGSSTHELKLYSFKDGITTYKYNIYADNIGTPFAEVILGVTFSKSGNILVVFGTTFVKLYSFINGVVTFIEDVAYEDNAYISHGIRDVCMCDENYIIIQDYNYVIYTFTYESGTSSYQIDTPCQYSGRYLKKNDSNYVTNGYELFRVVNMELTSVSRIYADNINTDFSGVCNDAIISDDNYIVSVGGDDYHGWVKLYQFTPTTITYIKDFPSDSVGTIYSTWVNNVNDIKDEYGNLFGFVVDGENIYMKYLGANLLMDNVIVPNNSDRYGYAVDNGVESDIITVKILERINPMYDIDLKSSNIKKDIDIFGEIGSYETDKLLAQKQGILFSTLLG